MKKSLIKLRKFFYHHPVYHFLFNWVGWVTIQIIANSLAEGSIHFDHFISDLIGGAIFSVLLTYFLRLIWQQSDQKKLYED